MQVNSLPVGYTDLLPSNPNCKDNGDGYLVCSITIDAPIGRDSILFGLYDQSGGGGHLLSKSSATVNVNGVEQNLSIAMHAVVQAIAVTPALATIPLSRTALSTPTFVKLAIAASDADHNIVTDDAAAPVPFNAPITVTDREQTGTTTGLVVVAHGVQPTATTPIKSVTVTDPSQDVYAAYFGNFIRAVAFDATSTDVTDPNQLTPGGFSTDCQGQFAVAQALPGMSAAKVRPSLVPQRGSRPDGSAKTARRCHSGICRRAIAILRHKLPNGVLQ